MAINAVSPRLFVFIFIFKYYSSLKSIPILFSSTKFSLKSPPPTLTFL